MMPPCEAPSLGHHYIYCTCIYDASAITPSVSSKEDVCERCNRSAPLVRQREEDACEGTKSASMLKGLDTLAQASKMQCRKKRKKVKKET
jgi:hypothetical protein